MSGASDAPWVAIAAVIACTTYMMSSRPCSTMARILDVCNHAIDRKAMKVAPAHLDDRAEAAVERAAARGLDDVDGAAHHRVAVEDPRRSIRLANGVAGQTR